MRVRSVTLLAMSMLAAVTTARAAPCLTEGQLSKLLKLVATDGVSEVMYPELQKALGLGDKEFDVVTLKSTDYETNVLHIFFQVKDGSDYLFSASAPMHVGSSHMYLTNSGFDLIAGVTFRPGQPALPVPRAEALQGAENECRFWAKIADTTDSDAH